jgi:hypothetical protein
VCPIKEWMGATHFKTKTLPHVATEMALHVLAYNIKRVVAILGVPGLIEAIEAFLSWPAVTMVQHPARGDADTNLRELSRHLLKGYRARCPSRISA